MLIKVYDGCHYDIFVNVEYYFNLNHIHPHLFPFTFLPFLLNSSSPSSSQLAQSFTFLSVLYALSHEFHECCIQEDE